jgi:predicted DNA-binding transcriptional regulator AlpA
MNNSTLKPNSTSPLLYRISSVMSLLEISHATVYRMVNRGELELVRLSARSSRITSDSVAKVVAGRQRTAEDGEKV